MNSSDMGCVEQKCDGEYCLLHRKGKKECLGQQNARLD